MLGNIKEVCRRLKKMLGIKENFEVGKYWKNIKEKCER